MNGRTGIWHVWRHSECPVQDVSQWKCLGFHSYWTCTLMSSCSLVTSILDYLMCSAVPGFESSLFIRWDPDCPTEPLGLCLIWGHGQFTAGEALTKWHLRRDHLWDAQGLSLEAIQSFPLTFHWLERITWLHPERKSRKWKIVNMWHHFCHEFKIRPYRMFCEADW